MEVNRKFIRKGNKKHDGIYSLEILEIVLRRGNQICKSDSVSEGSLWSEVGRETINKVNTKKCNKVSSLV